MGTGKIFTMSKLFMRDSMRCTHVCSTWNPGGLDLKRYTHVCVTWNPGGRDLKRLPQAMSISFSTNLYLHQQDERANLRAYNTGYQQYWL